MDVLWLCGEDGGVDEDADEDEDAVVDDEEMLREQCCFEYMAAGLYMCVASVCETTVVTAKGCGSSGQKVAWVFMCRERLFDVDLALARLAFWIVVVKEEEEEEEARPACTPLARFRVYMTARAHALSNSLPGAFVFFLLFL